MNGSKNPSDNDIKTQMEFKVFRDYIRKTAQVFLDISEELFTLAFSKLTNEQALASFLTNPQEFLLLICKKVDTSSESPKISCFLSLDKITTDSGEVVAFFKKQDIDLTKIKNQRNYLKQIFNVLMIGEIEENFDIMSLFHETLHQGIIPMLQNYKTQSKMGEELQENYAKSQNEYQQFNNLFKKFNDLEGTISQKIRTAELMTANFEVSGKIQQICKNVPNPTLQDVPEDLLSDQDFIQSISENRLIWVQKTEIMMNMAKDSKVNSVMEEVSFWVNLTKSLDLLQKELEKPSVLLTSDILKFLKKPHEIIQKEEFKSLRRNVEYIEKIMTNLNFNQALISLKQEENNMDMKELYAQLKKLVENNLYSTQRLKNFIQLMNKEYIELTTNLIREKNLFSLDYLKLQELSKSIYYFPIQAWDFNIDRIKEAVRISRKQELLKNTDVLVMNKEISNRVNYIVEIKTQHEQLAFLYQQTFGDENYQQLNLYKYNFPSAKDLEREFDIFFQLDAMDLSIEGSEKLKNAHSQYLKKTAEFDKKIVDKIHEIYKENLSNQEKFKVFSRFQKLQQRPYIKQELQNYQDGLIKIIQDDISRIIEKFKKEQDISRKSLIAKKYRISGFINCTIWNEQILNSLNENLKKLKENLGENWMQNPQGKEISNICESFKQEIEKNIKEIVKYCENKYNNKKEEKIFSIRQNAEGKHEIHVNINQQNKDIIKAIRLLFSWVEEINKKYYIKYMFKKNSWPSYVSMYMIEDAVNIFNSTIKKLTPISNKLLAKQLKTVYMKLEQANNYVWFQETENSEESIVEKFALNFSSAVNLLAQNTNYIESKEKIIEECFANIKKEEKKDKLFTTINDIQVIVNQFEERGFQNLKFYVEDLNQQIKTILIEKINLVILQWTFEFMNQENAQKEDFNPEEQKIIQYPTNHEVIVQNQQIHLDPPLESTRLFWLRNLQQVISDYCSLKKIRRKEDMQKIEDNQKSVKDWTFQNLAFEIPQENLIQAYQTMNECIDRAENYVHGWKSYQALWELDINKVYEFLGENASFWDDILNEIKTGRNQFDETEAISRFGPIVINVRIAQRKINNKYESLHTEILNKYGKNMAQDFDQFQAEIKQKRLEVEEIDFNDSEKIIQAISELRKCKDSMDKWQNTVNRFQSGEKLLREQKYMFPQNWKDFYIVESDWDRFKQSFEIKEQKYKSEYDNLKSKLLQEESGLMVKVKEIETTWRDKKPYSGSLHPKEALDVITGLEKKILEDKSKFDKLNEAKELLNLPLIDLTTINTIMEDSKSLKEMWDAIKISWEKVDKIMDTQMKVANPAKYQTQLDEIYEELNGLPNKFRTYEAVVTKKNQIGDIKKFNRMLKDIKTEAIKEQHWNQMLKEIKLMKKYQNLTVADFYNHKPQKYEKIINEIINSAQGELVLENMIKKIKTYWGLEEFQMGKYQEKCQLIRGWDEMMTKIEDDLALISSMKLSQHYKIFEEEIKSWNDKLVILQTVLDIWVNVQKKWVYLEGIFFGSSDISQQLPNEYSRFKSIDNDFTSLMKKAEKRKKILDTCLNIPNLDKSLKVLYDQLEKIQKALSDYLETQRQAFARFYFVGDEDLLEIIGNSKIITNIQKYFTKMFAGINYIENEENGVLLKAMRSREAEVVPFSKPFKISDYGKINLWLDELEYQMKKSLGVQFENGIESWAQQKEKNIQQLVEKYSAQVVLISFQTYWSFLVEEGKYKDILDKILNILDFMAEAVLTNLPKLTRSKYEQLITEFVHKRDTTRIIQKQGFAPQDSFYWFSQMKYVNNSSEPEIINRLNVNLGNSRFVYGYEYLGITEKLVQTPLTDKCYFTLTQALWLRMGGAPFGPAGTGKTESVKMLGSTLGRFVLVFNCDETFNFKAMGRIFIGLCQVGAWGCFDEFNRLEERILSAVSQQILAIQVGLREKLDRIDLMGKDVKLNVNMGIFVTMNPGYAGRSNLPENLKQLFRQMAMIKPDRELIAQVMLFSQGFKSAEQLSGKVVSLFELCADQLSSQPHYDFGLRALKSVLNSAGNLKRRAIDLDAEKANQPIEEQKIILRSFCDTVVPKLISEDAPLLESLIKGVFPEADIPKIEDLNLRKAIGEECLLRNVLETDRFVEKILQLNQILKLQHGIMLVGPTGCGKTAAWKILLSSLFKIDQIKGESYVIDPKAITKDDLYGRLDDTTMEWTDGIFTYILRKINENARGESNKRHWIIFDGDVDPEWVENLNSVLDDNKLLTLPNGERLGIPNNVKIMFEVESLKYATLATVSRCGMVWFSEDILKPQEIFYHYMMRLKMNVFDSEINNQNESFNKTREICVNAIEPLFFGKYIEQVLKNNNLTIDEEKSLILQAMKIAKYQEHVMEYSDIRVMEACFTLIRKGIERIVEYNEQFPDFPLPENIISKFMKNWSLISFNWAFVGDLKLDKRSDFFSILLSKQKENFSYVELPQINDKLTLIDYTVELKTGEWAQWISKVPQTDIDPKDVNNANTIITTVDTLRHQEILCSWLLEKRPFIICGPPGSGKTMTLMSTLRNLPDFDMIFVNFSSSTTPGLILKQFEHYCEYFKSTKGITLRPKQINKNLVLFCDEINLPDEDKYGTQYIITFLRQLTEQKGFWRNSDHSWIKLERIQFVGACNPPTDAGRHPLAPRFLRHSPLILVDFPGYQSLTQIYGTFNRAMLKPIPELRNNADELTKAMVEYYSQSQKRFTADQQAHYIYSPRELTRWKYAIFEGLGSISGKGDLVRLWAHEALRLFEDRLVTAEEKVWCQEGIDRIAKECFHGVDYTSSLQRPILFSTYLTKNYTSVQIEDLRKYVKEKLKQFNEEEYEIKLVVFDSVLDHILRIDRVLRQPIGHLLLVGASGVGKTTLSRFVSWMNGLSVYQIKAGRNYGLADFDANLRDVMKRAGCKQEKITFIFDESNVLGVAFLERMNALLASGEVPGLFEGEEYLALINNYKENQGNIKRVESEEEIYANFTKNVQRNLHVVFTMNPANPDFSNRAASSPAIFNRCVIDWFGDWSEDALHQVGKELTESMTIPENSLSKTDFDHFYVIEQLLVRIHNSVRKLNEQLQKSAKRFNYMTPRDFLDLIRHFNELHKEKKQILEEQQVHLNKGLSQLKNTEQKVQELDASLKTFRIELDKSGKEASEKMELITSEKSKAEEKQIQLTELQGILAKKQEEIKERTTIVQKDLDKAGPALEAAKKAVSQIDKKQLGSIKALLNPPQKIKMTLEGVCLLLTEKKLEWKDIVKTMVGSNFIKDILELDVDKKKKVRQKVLDNYINSKEWDVKAIYSAFGPAGILAEWLESQLSYADILNNVEPMRNEIKALQEEETKLLKQSQENTDTLKDIQEKLEVYKKEYKVLTQKNTKIKSDMEKVNEKVEKSKKLLENLSSEKKRWTESSEGFSDQLTSMTGDVMLCAAFLTYCGFFDKLYRSLLMKTWRKYMKEEGLKFKEDLQISEYLSKASDRMIWQSHKLPNDEICNQNAIILTRFNRYPLVIDPSGQALEFISSFYNERKIEKTDFQDNNFIKILEKSLRFGLPVLVQNVEKVDPMMNSVLNKEVVKTGGRILVRVGDQEIDFNNKFIMFMLTKNSEAKFTPDLCSRVTFVNFTVTQSSLENQCINMYLKNERPDIEQERIQLLKLQGEYQLQLRNLEDDLLTKISEQQGNILENEPLIQTLENLKIQANEINAKMKESKQVLEKVENVTNEYKQLSYFSAKIYFTLQQLAEVKRLYQYSFQFYMNILKLLMKKNERLNTVEKTDYEQRIKIMEEELFIQIYHKIENSLLTEDKLLVALKFSQLRLGKDFDEEFKILIEPCKIIESTWTNILEGQISKRQLILLENISKKSKFSGLQNSLKQKQNDWVNFIKERENMNIPLEWLPSKSDLSQQLIKILITSILKPSRAFELIKNFVNSVMSEKFLNTDILDIKNLILEDASAKSPIFFSSAPGFDPSSKINDVAKILNKNFNSIAIGSAEGFATAEQSLNRSMKTGSWVILKNVHLACSWLKEVEQKILKGQPHTDFRCFFVSEFNDKLPVTLLKISAKALFELPEGIKSNVFRTLQSVFTEEKMNQSPKERCKIYFQVVWLHAVIMERLRYCPIGWSKKYEFSEADLRSTIEIIDQFLEKEGDPLKAIVPLRSIITNNVYGGKIDNNFDSKILESLVNEYLDMKFFTSPEKHYYAKEGEQILIPGFKAENYQEYLEWIKKLNLEESPVWAGLPYSAEDILKQQNLQKLLSKMLAIQDINEEEIEDIKEKEAENSEKTQLKWLKELEERCTVYLKLLPLDLPLLQRNKTLIENPLFRFLEREVVVCSSLLKTVRKVLGDLIEMVGGRLQPLQYLKQLAFLIYSGEVPKEWRKYVFPGHLDISVWIQDFKKRLEQIVKFCKTKDWQRKGANVGLMLFPEAFLTASRQYVAQLKKCSLDNLQLKMSLTKNEEVDEDSFLVKEMSIEGVNWTFEGLKAEKKISFDLPNVQFKWELVDGMEAKNQKEGEIFVPIYLNNTRQQLLTPIKFDIKSSVLKEQLLYQRGIAFIVWNIQ